MTRQPTATTTQLLAQINHYAALANDPLSGLAPASQAQARELLAEATDLTYRELTEQARHVLDTTWQLIEG